MIQPNIIPHIQEQFNELICATQDIKVTDTHLMNSTKLLEAWSHNKERFYNLFGRTLIYDMGEEISCDISFTEKQKMLEEFVEEITWSAEEVKDEILKDSLLKLAGFLSEIMVEEFFQNRSRWDYRDKYPVKCDTKIVKAFKSFFPQNEYLDVITRIQQKASEIIQQGKVTGYLKFSIHPIDFLTISENNHNWSSCHSLHGDYTGGNLEYMTDNVTFVAYLSSNPGCEVEPIESIHGFQWNSKKWRMLVYVSEDNQLSFLGREYPFKNSKLLRLTQRFVSTVIIKEDCDNVFWEKSYDKLCQTCDKKEYECLPPSFFVGNKVYQVRDLISISDNHLHFNDLLFSSCYLPIAKIGKGYQEGDSMHIGGPPICPFCGERAVTSPHLLLCDECAIEHSFKLPEYYFLCDRCGGPTHDKEAHYLREDDMVVCEECYQEMKEERNED